MPIWLLVPLILAACVLGFVWFTRKVWFFRDPNHSGTPQAGDEIRSPVYGRVAYIRRICEGQVICVKKGEEIPIADITKEDWVRSIEHEVASSSTPPPNPLPISRASKQGGRIGAPLPNPSAQAGERDADGWLIGIAMTALDVHYQYAPIAGRVGEVRHHSHGRNLPMFDLWEYVRITWLRRGVQLFAKKYVFQNERQTMWIDGDGIRLALVLIADKFVSKITTFVKPGDEVRAGQKVSFIGRGSQVDVVVCGHPGLEVLVREGEAVKGPLTVLARVGSRTGLTFLLQPKDV